MYNEKKKLDSPKFTIGELVKHRYYPFRGVIFDVDPEFMNSENDDGPYIAYVSQQNLLHDENLDPCSHPQISSVFAGLKDGKYILKDSNLQ